MSEKAVTDKATKLGASPGAESPTTARPLDFDDENENANTSIEQAGSLPQPSKSPKPGVRFSEGATEIPPAKPPRPVDTKQQAENTLIEAFPGIDAKVVKAVLLASGGQVEPAFNALLSMSDPSFKAEEVAPPQPPRPTQPRSQMEQDEIYARQLAEHYQTSSQGYGQGQGQGDPSRQQRPVGSRPGDPHEERSFFDDDLPEIRRNIEQEFKETQTKVNKWVSGFMKKLNGEPEEYDKYGDPVARPERRQNFGSSQSDQLHGIRKSAESRRSADRERYDNDNRMLDDNFDALHIRDHEGTPPPKPARPLANPDLFKPTPVAPPQSGPVDEVDAIYRNPSPNGQTTGVIGAKGSSKKWQPLTSVAPNPEPDDHDPFSLGDSDEEDAKTKDTRADDTERLKKAAADKDGATTQLKPAERSGSIGQKDAVAEALLKDSK